MPKKSQQQIARERSLELFEENGVIYFSVRYSKSRTWGLTASLWTTFGKLNSYGGCGYSKTQSAIEDMLNYMLPGDYKSFGGSIAYVKPEYGVSIVCNYNGKTEESYTLKKL